MIQVVRASKLDGPKPENYGAAGDDSTDDTNAIQAAIDVALAADDKVDVLFDPLKTYRVESAPRHDLTGNSILSIQSGVGTKQAVGLRSNYSDNVSPWNGQKATIKTTRTGDTYSATYGPPSMIGGQTEEQGWGPINVCGPVHMKDIKFQLPLNPAIAAIDAISWGGVDFDESVVVVAGAGTDATSLPTNKHAFGIRYPGSWGFGFYNTSAQVFQMFAGHVLRMSDHVRFKGAQAHQCTLGLGLQANVITQGHTTAPGYVSLEHCDTYVGGWDPVSGVVSVASASAPIFYFGNLVVDIELGTGAFAGTQTILDDNNMIGGEIQVHRYTGLGVDSTVGPVSGAQNSNLRALRKTIQNIPAAGSLDISQKRGGRVYKVTGTTAINYISQMSLADPFTLWFSSTAAINHNTGSVPAGYGAILLNGSQNFTGAANRVLTLFFDGTTFQETGRKTP